jgi:hypothetical protein
MNDVHIKKVLFLFVVVSSLLKRLIESWISGFVTMIAGMTNQKMACVTFCDRDFGGGGVFSFR